MSTRVGKIKLAQRGSRTVIAPPRPRQSVSQRIGAEKKAARQAAAWRAASKAARE